MALEKFKYINHLNEEIEFGKGGIYADTNELRNYEWTVNKRSNMIGSFRHDIVKRKLPVVIMCSTVEEGLAKRNRLYEVLDKDVVAHRYGRIVIGDYYMQCFVMQSQKADYLTAERCIMLTLTVTTDQPVWVKETKHIFRKAAESGAGGKNLDYPFDYAFDFRSSTNAETINNTGINASNFRLVIYGECSDPEIKIGDHLYKISGKIEANEYLTIDSTTKEIYVTTITGERVNRFDDRYRKSYIFEKIPVGSAAIVWGGEYGIDLIVLDERSEPKWI